MAVHLELFYSPYCRRCGKARRQLRSLADAWPAKDVEYRERDVLQELDRAVEIGVLQTPALAIDGKLVAGPVPSRRALDMMLRERLTTEDSR